MISISLINYEYKWSNLRIYSLQTWNDKENEECPNPSSLASWHTVVTSFGEFTTYSDAIERPRGSVFKQNWPSPMALAACLAWKAPLLFRSQTLSISNSPFIFLRQWKRRAEQLKSLMQLEHFHVLSRSCFTINEWHLIFPPNISINLTAGMLWLLIAERKTCLKKGTKEAFSFFATPISGETVWKGFAPGTKSQEKFVPACSHSMGLKHHRGWVVRIKQEGESD